MHSTSIYLLTSTKVQILTHKVRDNSVTMRLSDTRELCDFVSAHTSEFNHLQNHTHGILPKPLAQALQTLKESALQNMQDFGAQ